MGANLLSRQGGEVDSLGVIGGYTIDIVIQGYPGKAVENGGLGWSTVVLLRGHGRVVMLDTGSFGQRLVLKSRLAELGVSFRDVTDVILTHSHWDHIVNYPLFSEAALHIGGKELAWANSGDSSVYAVPELYTRQLEKEPRLNILKAGQNLLPGIVVHDGPGHTPGHLVFQLVGTEYDVLFVQDAAKSRAELVSRSTDLTIDPALSTQTIEGIWALWRQRNGSVLVPGHDLPMVLRDGDDIEMIGHRRAGIVGFLGDELEDKTIFSLGKAEQ